jgi:hypothetical protein
VLRQKATVLGAINARLHANRKSQEVIFCMTMRVARNQNKKSGSGDPLSELR